MTPSCSYIVHWSMTYNSMILMLRSDRCYKWSKMTTQMKRSGQSCTWSTKMTQSCSHTCSSQHCDSAHHWMDTHMDLAMICCVSCVLIRWSAYCPPPHDLQLEEPEELVYCPLEHDLQLDVHPLEQYLPALQLRQLLPVPYLPAAHPAA